MISTLVFKSKFYQTEILRWGLVLSLLVWAVISSLFALTNNREVILVAIDGAGSARLISEKDDRFLRNELKAFLQAFFDGYYTFDQTTFDERVGAATDLMSKDLWEREKPKVATLSQKLKSNPLSQASKIRSLDLIEEGRVEAILEVKVRQRVSEETSLVKVVLKYEPHARSKENSWGYQIIEVSDAVL